MLLTTFARVVGLSSVCAMTLVSCGGDDGSPGGGQGGSGGTSPLPLPACNGDADVVLGIDKLLVGDTDPSGAQNPTNGWKQYGMNLDGRVTISTPVGLCKPRKGGSPSQTHVDGNGGIDNAFGKNVLPVLLGLTADFGSLQNAAIAKGGRTYLVSLAKLGAESSCSTSGALFLGSSLGKTPLWDGTDAWPIEPSSLLDPADPTSAKVEWGEVRVDQNVVSSLAAAGTFDLVLELEGYLFRLPIHHARISMKLSDDHQGAIDGQIGGILDTQDVLVEAGKMMGFFSADLCNPSSPTRLAILKQLEQASDILLDGTQDSAKECEAISIGLGFTMKAAKLGDLGAPITPTPAPCP